MRHIGPIVALLFCLQTSLDGVHIISRPVGPSTDLFIEIAFAPKVAFVDLFCANRVFDEEGSLHISELLPNLVNGRAEECCDLVLLACPLSQGGEDIVSISFATPNAKKCSFFLELLGEGCPA